MSHPLRPLRFLLATWDGGGVVPPQLSIARQLVARGHAVRVLADPTIEEEALAAGCSFTPWQAAPHRATRHRKDDLLRDYAAKNPMAYFKTDAKAFLADAAPRWTDDLLAAIDAWPPDVVLTDYMIPWGSLAAEIRGLPCAVLSTTIHGLPTPGVPPMGASMIPAWGPLATLRDGALRWMMEWMFDQFRPQFAAERARHGLPALPHTLDQVRRADALLVLTSPAFDPAAPSRPPKTAWVGPQLDDPTWCASWTSPWAEGDPRPLVLVGLSSTFQDQVPFLTRAVAALATLPVRALVTLGPTLTAEEVPGADNVVVVPSVPHGRVLPEAALLVTHNGHGTTLKALAAGVPMVCVPMGRDQSVNAARVVELGAGVKLARTADVETIRATLLRVLGTPGYREAARAVADTLARGEGVEDAATLLEGLAPARDAAGVRRAVTAGSATAG